MLGQLDRLDEVVEHAPAGGDEALAERVDRLVVVGLGGVPHLPARPRGQRARRQPHVVVGVVEGARARAGGRCGRRRRAGAARASRPARRSSAASRGRCPSTGRSRSNARSASAISRAVAVGARVGGLRMARAAVGARVDVRAAGQHEPVEPVEHVVGMRRHPRVGRDHQRDRARALQRVHVGAREQERLAIPYRPARPLQRGAEADPGSPAGVILPALPASQLDHTQRIPPMTVQDERRGAVATIVLDRPDAMNAVDAQLGADLLAALKEAAADDDVRAVVLTGSGRAFSSGADLQAGFDARPRTAARTSRRRCASAFTRSSRASARCPSPSSPRSTAPRRASAARSRSPATSSSPPSRRYFLLAFVNVGLVPDGGSSVLIPERVGLRPRGRDGDARRARARPRKALEWGLINRVVTDDELTSGGRGARRPPRRRAHALLRGHQTAAQRLAVRAHGRAARARGDDPAGDGRHRTTSSRA